MFVKSGPWKYLQDYGAQNQNNIVQLYNGKYNCNASKDGKILWCIVDASYIYSVHNNDDFHLY